MSNVLSTVRSVAAMLSAAVREVGRQLGPVVRVVVSFVWDGLRPLIVEIVLQVIRDLRGTRATVVRYHVPGEAWSW